MSNPNDMEGQAKIPAVMFAASNSEPLAATSTLSNEY